MNIFDIMKNVSYEKLQQNILECYPEHEYFLENDYYKKMYLNIQQMSHIHTEKEINFCENDNIVYIATKDNIIETIDYVDIKEFVFMSINKDFLNKFEPSILIAKCLVAISNNKLDDFFIDNERLILDEKYEKIKDVRDGKLTKVRSEKMQNKSLIKNIKEITLGE